MSEYWVSQGRKMCSYCRCWIADNKASINFHEQGKKHKENVKLKLDELRKKGLQDSRNKNVEADAMAAIERAAMESFKKDIGAGSSSAYGSISLTDDSKLPKSEPARAAEKEDKSSEDGNKEYKALWEQAVDEQGYTYYWNTETYETSWTLPGSDDTSQSQQPVSATGTAVKRSAPTGYGQWETVREEEPVVYDLGLPNQPAYNDTPTKEATSEQNNEELNTEDIPLPTEDIPLPPDSSEAAAPTDSTAAESASLVPERRAFKTKTVALAPTKKVTGDGAPKFKKPKFSANRKARTKDEDS